MTKEQIEKITSLIAQYAEEERLVPIGHQLHVNLDIKPAPPVPIVVVLGNMPELANVPLNTLRLPTRVLSALLSNEITTVSELFEKVKKLGSANALITRIRNFGRVSLIELTTRLKSEGFVLGPEWR